MNANTPETPSDEMPSPMRTSGQEPNRRRRKLIRPRVQLGFAATFSGIVLLALLLQALLLGSAMLALADALPSGGAHLVDHVPGSVGRSLLVSLGVILPLTIAVGILTTFRVVGPIYRLEQYLGQMLRDEPRGPCRLRKGEAFQDVCELINRVDERLRRAEAAEREGDADVPGSRAA